MGMSRAGECDACGLRWRERVPGELCPVCTTKQSIANHRTALARVTAERDEAIARAERAERAAVATLRKFTAIGKRPRFIPWGDQWVSTIDGDVYGAIARAVQEDQHGGQ